MDRAKQLDTPHEDAETVSTAGPPVGIRGEMGGMATHQDFEFAQLHHVQLAIPPVGEDACRAFWGGTLGMVELVKPPVLAARGGCWFRGGGLEVHLGVEKDFAAAKKAHPGVLVKDLSGLAARLEASGVSAKWDDDFPGFSRFYADDPFGNRLEFLEPRPE